MRTPEWIKKLGGHAGELFVCAELSKRGIPNALLPENFSDDDILVGDKEGTKIGYVQVKACHPDRADSFILGKCAEDWCEAGHDHYCIFVWLGRTDDNEPPRYWIASKQEVGQACVKHSAHGTSNWERRFFPHDTSRKKTNLLPQEWCSNWSVFNKFMQTTEP